MSATLGILILDTQFPRIAGDVGNADSFEFPVVYERLSGIGPQQAVRDAPGRTDLIDLLVAAADRLVQRGAVPFGGTPIKWLGDGVMFHFRDPGPAVRAALHMLDRLAAAGLPPAHVGLHTGPVLFQQGDYFGQTVNLSARIADYAGPGEVLVSKAVADASEENGITFVDIGEVELKGVLGSTHLLRAQNT